MYTCSLALELTKGAAAALERNLRQLWLAPLSVRDASAASCRREQAKCGGALEVERAAHMWHLLGSDVA